jgi:hypothetical protein
MARMNAAYGSELHLLRMLGRHRGFFDRHLCIATGADDVEWLDFPSGEMRRDKSNIPTWDREWHHLQFLADGDPAKIAWDNVWPTHRPGHKWDAIARLRYRDVREWLLIEAKGNLEELSSTCGAKDESSLKMIRQTLDRTKMALGAAETSDWMTGYYQFCNRLAALHTMNSNGSAARLVFVYFCGDVTKDRTCPNSKSGWDDELKKVEKRVGLAGDHALNERVHKVFIDVGCSA